MNAQQLDAIARHLARGLSRRRLFPVFAGILGAQLAPPADALACKKLNKKFDKSKECCNGTTCKGGKCKCKGGDRECGNACVNLENDDPHCGACNNACSGATPCENGVCAEGGSTLIAERGGWLRREAARRSVRYRDLSRCPGLRHG